jgi:hypothetical protein
MLGGSYSLTMLLTELAVTPGELASRTGWEAKPEGLCKGDLCVPAPGVTRDDGRLDVEVLSDRLRMPLVHDEAHGLWALGPATVGGKALDTVVVPDLELPDRDGNPFKLSALHGRKVLLVAWASW